MIVAFSVIEIGTQIHGVITLDFSEKDFATDPDLKVAVGGFQAEVRTGLQPTSPDPRALYIHIFGPSPVLEIAAWSDFFAGTPSSPVKSGTFGTSGVGGQYSLSFFWDGSRGIATGTFTASAIVPSRPGGLHIVQG